MTDTTIDRLDAQDVRAWVDGTLVLIGGRVRVTEYMPGYVRVTSDVPFGPGCILRADTKAHREPSGAWTVIA